MAMDTYQNSQPTNSAQPIPTQPSGTRHNNYGLLPSWFRRGPQTTPTFANNWGNNQNQPVLTRVQSQEMPCGPSPMHRAHTRENVG
eukprot:CAMPEP_0181097552 /NCGR_PEP_ID=MMETSP1071-20121207/11629_1 /TAXON_ID=35127 /ORGANISM="Thalassiosira sp., Strain NH16" /LENGTH=85 /DNA_ID=CAMNT_0023180039 /DNA_START=33 /DNA_END=286 /DNA_ORIENTATION=+